MPCLRAETSWLAISIYPLNLTCSIFKTHISPFFKRDRLLINQMRQPFFSCDKTCSPVTPKLLCYELLLSLHCPQVLCSLLWNICKHIYEINSFKQITVCWIKMWTLQTSFLKLMWKTYASWSVKYKLMFRMSVVKWSFSKFPRRKQHQSRNLWFLFGDDRKLTDTCFGRWTGNHVYSGHLFKVSYHEHAIDPGTIMYVGF